MSATWMPGVFPDYPALVVQNADGEYDSDAGRDVSSPSMKAPQDQTADIVVPQPLAAAADGFEPGIEFRVFHGEPVHDLTLAN